jgi:uroporphyrin-III C-methyltransferase
MGLPLTFPRISLVGAGPGDPELITLKAVRVIKSADVILYDALLNEELLEYARPGVPLLYVGKRCGKHAMGQEAINELLIDSASRYGHAVRLKGGDPFVFGRGGEEWAAARSARVPVTIVPGVSSALAVPALAGIPLTHRGLSRGFWVLTATTQGHQLPKEMEEAARSGVTVVILMGTRKAAEIAALFSLYRPAKTPIALLQSGSLPDHQATVETISDVSEIVAAAQNGARGILVVGDVVNVLNGKNDVAKIDDLMELGVHL